MHQKSNCVCVWAQAVFVHVRACAHLMCRCGCKYVCVHMRMCICMRACMHLHMVHKCAKVISLTPRCGGDPIRAPKWSRCGLLCVRFLFGIEQEENRGKLLRRESPAREPEMAGAFACARKHLVCTCICASLRAYMVAPSAMSHCSQA